MKFLIQVNSPPYQSARSLTALQFTAALLKQKHELLRVFFYHEGIYHAMAHTQPPDDELNLTQAWQNLAQQYSLDLVVCISAAQRRGLLHEDELQRLNKLESNLASGFRISGLGQLIEASLLADRTVVFG